MFIYIRAIAKMLRPGGLFSSMGPLLYHFAEQAQDVSIELSWEELREPISKYFDIKEEKFMKAYYTGNSHSLMSTEYDCMFFVAIRNDTPIEGVSNSVYDD